MYTVLIHIDDIGAMEKEAKNLEHKNEVENREFHNKKTLKDKVFNLYLLGMAGMFSSAVLFFFDNKKESTFYSFLGMVGGLIFTYEYLNSSGFLDNPHIQEKMKKIEDRMMKSSEGLVRTKKSFFDRTERIEKFLEGLFTIISIVIGLSVVVIGLAYLFFGILGSLSVSSLLIIIILILLLK